MVKLFLALMVVVVVAGSAIGYTVSKREYAWNGEQFGHFSKTGELRAEDLPARLKQLEQKGLPKVEVVGGVQFDFGTMLRRAEGEHDFTLKNTGNAPLELNVIGTTCKCTLGELQDASLAPGESTVVHMSWTVKTEGDDFGQTATISTTDPFNGELQLKISGDVVDPLSVVPASWNVGEVTPATPLDLTGTVYNNLGYDIQYKDTKWFEDFPEGSVTLDVQERPIDDGKGPLIARQAFDIHVIFPSGIEQGLFSHSGFIEFEPVDLSGAPERGPNDLKSIIRLEGRVVGDLSLKGNSRLVGRDSGRYLYSIPTVTAGQGTEDQLMVFVRGPHRNDAQLKIGEIDPESVLEAELGEPRVKDELVAYTLKLRVREDAPAMERLGITKDDYGTVWIRSDNEDIAPLLLRVKFNVRDGG